MGSPPHNYYDKHNFRAPHDYLPKFALWKTMCGDCMIKDAYTKALETVALRPFIEYPPIDTVAKTRNGDYGRNHQFYVYSETEPFQLAYNAAFALYKAAFVREPDKSALLRWCVEMALYVTLQPKENELRQTYMEMMCNRNDVDAYDVTQASFAIGLHAQTEDLITVAMAVQGNKKG